MQSACNLPHERERRRPHSRRRWRPAENRMARRIAFYDYTDPQIAPQAVWVTMVLARGQTTLRIEPAVYRFSVAVHRPRVLPAALNGFGLWLGLMVALTIVNYGFPIAHSLATQGTAVPAIKVGER